MKNKGGTKFRALTRKKKRGFFGKRPHEVQDDLPNATSVTDQNPSCSDVSVAKSTNDCVSITSKKLLNTSFEKLESSKGILTCQQAKEVGIRSPGIVEIASGFKLQDAVLLSKCISTAAICSSCRQASSKLELYQRNNEREGLCESLFLKCSSCSVETPLATSKRVGGKGGGSHEVNRRSVLVSHQYGHAGLSQFCGGMNLPPPVTKKAYNEHLIHIEKAASSHAEEVMQDAAHWLKEKIRQEQPDNMECGETNIAHIAVTVDGTWQERGHSSKIGVIFVISVDTGEILDYEVKSLFCNECKEHSKMEKESEDYKHWKDNHKLKCEINLEGSSEEMEAAAAVQIFKRSIKTRELKYTTFVGEMKVYPCMSNISTARSPAIHGVSIGKMKMRELHCITRIIACPMYSWISCSQYLQDCQIMIFSVGV